ncbi:MAG TPA: hypothetical protein VIV40_38900 [Kofleriaceae bacterium]
MTRVAALVAIGLCGACGTDDVDLTGMYAVDGDVGSMPCGTDQPLPMPPAYVKFQQETIFGSDYYAMLTCVDAAGTNCEGGGLFGDSFTEPIDGGWRGIITTSSGTTTCLLSYTELTAKLASSKLVVETNQHSEEVTDGSPCTTDEAQKRNTAMPCTEHERLDATRL